MDISDLKLIATRSKSMREIGVALLLAVAVLTLFLFIPLKSKTQTTPSPIVLKNVHVPNAFASVPIEAKAAIVYDLTTGATLYKKNANAQLPLASLTKLLTVYAALSEFSPKTLITIPPEVLGMSAPRAFTPGEVFTLSNLARLTLTASLNDGAASIAKATAERKGDTTRAMLASAAAGLNLTQTYAINGSGLDLNSAISGGYGSAHDVAILSGALIKKAPKIAAATTKDSAVASSVQGISFTVKNTDPVVGTIPHLLLSKTGYTDLAGGNLALVFDVGIGHPIAVIVLGSSRKARFTDGQALVAATFAHFAGVTSL